MQRVYAAQQNGSSEFRPRSHYYGLHGWNNDHNGTECRGMARDQRFTPAMRAATTHVGTGGNPKVGVPVGFVCSSLFAASPFWPAQTLSDFAFRDLSAVSFITFLVSVV